jgi:hypothetical protein
MCLPPAETAAEGPPGTAAAVSTNRIITFVSSPNHHLNNPPSTTTSPPPSTCISPPPQENGILYGAAGAAAAVGLVCIFAVERALTVSDLVALLMGISNTFALSVGLLLMGYGLVEIPREMWKSRPEQVLKWCAHR